MFKCKVFTVGRCRESWLAAALEEYEKRLKGVCEIDWILCKSNTQLIQHAEESSGFIALDPNGQLLDSEALSRKLWVSARLSFFIGGAEGLPKEVLKRASWSWSLSPLTFPHQLVRLIWVEQIYRSMTIFQGLPYHK